MIILQKTALKLDEKKTSSNFEIHPFLAPIYVKMVIVIFIFLKWIFIRNSLKKNLIKTKLTTNRNTHYCTLGQAKNNKA